MEPIYRSTCPHCGHVNVGRCYSAPSSRPEVIVCDVDAGGCDEPYAVRLRVDVVVADTFKLEKAKAKAR